MSNAAPICCCIAQAIAPPSIAVCKGHPTPSLCSGEFRVLECLKWPLFGIAFGGSFWMILFWEDKAATIMPATKNAFALLGSRALGLCFFWGRHVTESDVPWSRNLHRDSDSEEEDCSFVSGLWKRGFPVILFRDRWNGLLCQEEVVAQKEPEVEQTYEAAPAVEFEAETMGWWSWRLQPFWILVIQ